MIRFLKVIKIPCLFFSRTDVLCVTLLWFIIILVLGTISQQEIGLLSVQQKYFTSSVFWLFNYIPLPGSGSIFFFIVLGLIVRLINKWSIKKIGIFFIHCGVVLLFLGGFITMCFSLEGFIVIKQKDSCSGFVKKHSYDLVVSKDNLKILRLSLSDSLSYKLSNDISIIVKKIYKNGSLKNRVIPLNEAAGAAKFFSVETFPFFVEDENNKFAVEFLLCFSNNNLHLLLLENEVNYVNVSIADIIYKIELVKTINTLPFSIYLESFKKDVYSNSMIPKAYKSVISIKDNECSWKYTIKMNEPLRYKGFVFYQTSFIENPDGLASVLLVTKDYGEFFPYISCFFMLLGFIIHLFRVLF